MPKPEDGNDRETAGARVPRRLAGFELLDRIGRGGMGTVFKAHQVDLDRYVALKVLSPRLARNDRFVEQFLREARSAGRLNHPNIVAAIDVGESEGFYYFAMEYVDGETLAALLRREGPLAEERALAIAIEVAKALEVAHHHGLVHRDIKPQNIMITRDGRVRVTDFGLARAVDPDGKPTRDSSRFLGTPAYMAPEQVRAEPDIDCRADIFSLGVTLFEMLTGQRPFQGANTVAIAAAVIAEPLPSIRKQRPDVSLATCRVVEKMTAKDRAARHATPTELIAALEAAAHAPRISPRTAGAARRSYTRRRRSSPAAAIAILVVIAALAAVAVVLVRQSHRSRRQPRPRRVQPGTKHSATSKRPPPPEPVATTPGERLCQRLQADVAQAEEFAQAHPQAHASQLERYRNVLADYPPRQQAYLPREGLDLIAQLREKIQQVQETRRAAAQAELAERRERAQALLDAGKVREAIRLFTDFPAELHGEETESALAAERRRLFERLETLYTTLEARARELVEQQSFEEAKAVYEPVLAWGDRDFSRRARRAIARIEALAEEHDSELVRQALRAYPKRARALLELLGNRRYDEAGEALTAALEAPELEPVRARLHRIQAILQASEDVLAHAAAAARELQPGDTVRCCGVGGRFVRFEDGKIYFRSDTVTIARGLTELRAQELVSLAVASYGDEAEQARPSIALFLLGDGDARAARRGLEAAQAKGQDVSEAMEIVRRLAPRECPRCAGEKTIPCPACGGKGYANAWRVPCDACDGRGWTRCSRCGGRGGFPCRFCKGTGEVFRGIVCGNCEGTGRIKCKACGGDGRIRCKKCDGAGHLVKTTPCPRCQGKKVVPCPTCDGKGHLPPLDLVVPSRLRPEAEPEEPGEERSARDAPRPKEPEPEEP